MPNNKDGIFIDYCMDDAERELAKQRKILIRCPISGDLVDDAIKMLFQFEFSSDEPITLLIDSKGGSVREAFHLKDVIDSIHAPVDGIVIGQANSAALSILQMCRHRKALPNTEFFLHFQSYSQRITVDVDEFSQKDKDAYFEDMTAFKKRKRELRVQRTNLNAEELEEIYRRGERLKSHHLPEQMLEWGFIDEILTDFKLFGGDWHKKSLQEGGYHT